MENIKLLVAMHKAYCLPEDAVYAPIQVGGVPVSYTHLTLPTILLV